MACPGHRVAFRRHCRGVGGRGVRARAPRVSPPGVVAGWLEAFQRLRPLRRLPGNSGSGRCDGGEPRPLACPLEVAGCGPGSCAFGRPPGVLAPARRPGCRRGRPGGGGAPRGGAGLRRRRRTLARRLGQRGRGPRVDARWALAHRGDRRPGRRAD